MFSGKPKKSVVAVLIVVIVIVILVIAGRTSTERNNISKPEQFLREVLAPLQNGASIVSAKLQTIPAYFKGIKKVEVEKEELQTQVGDLQHELVGLAEIREENIRLKALLKMANSLEDTWDYSATTVINRSQSSWYKTMIISGGEDRGFAIGMPVVAAEGLVGRIINVSKHTSEVLLILDREGAVGAIIQNTRTVGVVEGVDNEPGSLSLIHIPYDEKIENYQKVITSGMGGVYPKGLLIGYIKEIEMESGGLMLKATVQSFVDFNRLEEVMVLVPKGSSTEPGA